MTDLGEPADSRRLSSAFGGRGRRRAFIVSGLALLAFLCLGVATASPANPRAFRWLVPAPAPAGWKHVRLPAGDAILAYPPRLSTIHSDRTSASVGTRDKSGRIHVYLNSTPRQGDENLGNWPQFRIAHNRAESIGVHKDAGAVGLTFLNAVGSCVIDHYTTRNRANHYREIACFVQGNTTASVVVAAALESEWTRAAPLLERAISAYRAR